MAIFKSPHGTYATSDYVVDGDRIVRIITMKRSNGKLETTATAGLKNGMFFSYMPYQDFSKVIISNNCRRATTRIIQLQHDSVELEKLVVEIKAFYDEKAAA